MRLVCVLIAHAVLCAVRVVSNHDYKQTAEKS